MKRLFTTALLASAVLAHAQTPASAPPAASTTSSPAKKELVLKILAIQQPGIEGMARNMVEQPALRMMQAAAQALQQEVPPEKRDAAGKAIETDIKKYVDDATPIVRDRAIKLAPSTIGATLEEKFSEEELKQLVALLESPVNKKYAQIVPEMQGNFSQKLIAETRPLIEPRLQTLDAKVRASLGIPATQTAPAKASAPKKAASK